MPKTAAVTLPVKSTRPINSVGLTEGGSAETKDVLQSKKIEDGVYECQVPTLITPRMTIQKGVAKRVRYAILEVSIIAGFVWW